MSNVKTVLGVGNWLGKVGQGLKGFYVVEKSISSSSVKFQPVKDGLSYVVLDSNSNAAKRAFRRHLENSFPWDGIKNDTRVKFFGSKGAETTYTASTQALPDSVNQIFQSSHRQDTLDWDLGTLRLDLKDGDIKYRELDRTKVALTAGAGVGGGSLIVLAYTNKSKDNK
jgi:hypothetical protein